MRGWYGYGGVVGVGGGVGGGEEGGGGGGGGWEWKAVGASGLACERAGGLAGGRAGWRAGGRACGRARVIGVLIYFSVYYNTRITIIIIYLYNIVVVKKSPLIN